MARPRADSTPPPAITACSECGTDYPTSANRWHQAGRFCLVQSTRQWWRDLGMVPVARAEQSWCTRLRIPVRVMPNRQQVDGVWARRSPEITANVTSWLAAQPGGAGGMIDAGTYVTYRKDEEDPKIDTAAELQLYLPEWLAFLLELDLLLKLDQQLSGDDYVKRLVQLAMDDDQARRAAMVTLGLYYRLEPVVFQASVFQSKAGLRPLVNGAADLAAKAAADIGTVLRG